DPKANWRALFTSGYDAATNTVDGEWVPVEIGDGIYVGIDANGDGLQDLLHQPSEVSKREGDGARGYVNLAFRVDLYINTGRGQLVPSGRFLEMNDEELLASKVIDYNGDGFEDLLYPAPPGLAELDEWVVAYGGPVPFQMAHYPLD